MRGPFFSAFFMALLVAASNYWVKVPINDWITWGAFFYPFTFFVTELTNYFYGSLVARRVVYIGFLVAILFSVLVSDFRIGFASTAAFLISQLLDIGIFSKLRNRSWWIAPAVASVIATFLDSLIFFALAFAGTEFPWITVAIGTFFTKGLIDMGLLIPFRMFLSILRSKNLSPTTLNTQEIPQST
jgi:uncharacterized PurR-regulated membrane protein YhhQ (DUF165 family)